MSAFLKSLSPENSGETWLLVNDHKCKVRIASEEAAKRLGEKRTRNFDKHFYDFVMPESLNEPLIDSEDEGNNLSRMDVLQPEHFEPAWQKRCGIGGFSEQEPSHESMLSRCSMALYEMTELLGKSFETLFENGSKKSASASHKAFTKLITDIENARAAGASEDEVMLLAERRLGQYFPQVVKKYERLQAMKRAALAKQPVRGSNSVQQDLFEETV